MSDEKFEIKLSATGEVGTGLSIQNVRQLVAQREVAPTDLIREVGGEEWHVLSSVKGLEFPEESIVRPDPDTGSSEERGGARKVARLARTLVILVATLVFGLAFAFGIVWVVMDEEQKETARTSTIEALDVASEQMSEAVRNVASTVGVSVPPEVQVAGIASPPNGPLWVDTEHAIPVHGGVSVVDRFASQIEKGVEYHLVYNEGEAARRWFVLTGSREQFNLTDDEGVPAPLPAPVTILDENDASVTWSFPPLELFPTVLAVDGPAGDSAIVFQYPAEQFKETNWFDVSSASWCDLSGMANELSESPRCSENNALLLEIVRQLVVPDYVCHEDPVLTGILPSTIVPDGAEIGNVVKGEGGKPKRFEVNVGRPGAVRAPLVVAMDRDDQGRVVLVSLYNSRGDRSVDLYRYSYGDSGELIEFDINASHSLGIKSYLLGQTQSSGDADNLLKWKFHYSNGCLGSATGTRVFDDGSSQTFGVEYESDNQCRVVGATCLFEGFIPGSRVRPVSRTSVIEIDLAFEYQGDSTRWERASAAGSVRCTFERSSFSPTLSSVKESNPYPQRHVWDMGEIRFKR
jgi:hypothetical protein